MRFSAKLNPTQSEFIKDLSSPFLHFSGGFGSGKTFALCMKVLQLSYLNRETPGGLVSQDYQEFKRDVLPEMEGILERARVRYKYHGTDHYFQFPWTPHKLYVATADKKIRGPNWGYAGINEVTLIPVVRYKEVIGRIRAKKAKFPQVASVGTPEGFGSEYYEYFMEKPPAGLSILYGSTDENMENLDEGYIGRMEASYDKAMLKTYRGGLWINMTGNQFYYNYSAKLEDRSLNPTMFSIYHISMDFNVDPFTATIWGFDGARIYGLDQINLEGSDGFDTKKMIAAMRTRGFYPGNSVIYPDPAGKARSTKGESDVKQLTDAGYRVRVKSMAPNFRRRQLNAANLMEKGLVLLNPDKCSGIRKDFLAVEQDVATQEKKKDNPKLTHFSDGFDYMVDILFPYSGDMKRTTVERNR